MPAKYDFAVVIGRFQPYTRAHQQLLKTAARVANHVIVAIGSSNRASSPKHPFTPLERASMISRDTEVKYREGGLHFVHLPDSLYNDDKWTQTVQDVVNGKILEVMNRATPNVTIHGLYDIKVALVGCKKDTATTYYLGLFPRWKFVDTDVVMQGLDATKVRSIFYKKGIDAKELLELVPLGTAAFLQGFINTSSYRNLVDWFEHNATEKEKFKDYPYKGHLNIACADVVATQMGHVALVTRTQPDGRGLLALPGGHKSEIETYKQAAIRECHEELGLHDEHGRIPEGRLFGYITGQGVQFDHPDRSERGCVATTAFRMEFPPKRELFKISGGDDADSDPNKTRWYSYSELSADRFFEDHAFILEAMLGIDIP